MSYRQQQRLKPTDAKRDELERKEKGFVLYMNGANAGGGAVPRTARRPQSSHKTATDCMLLFLDFFLSCHRLSYLQCAQFLSMYV